MKSKRSSGKWMKDAGILVFGAAVFSAFLQTTLSAPELANSLWPADIHQIIVEFLGGSVQKVGNQIITSLAWSAVLIRTMMCAVLALLPAIAGTRSVNSGSEAANRLGRVWLASGIWLISWGLAPLIPNDLWTTFHILTSPFWIAGFAAASFCSLLPTGGRAEAPNRNWQPYVLGIAILTWIATSFWMNERLYAGLWIPHGDSAMYEEHLWNTWHGKGFRSYLDQGLFLGEHIQVIHLLLLPLHMIWPSHLMLELVESISLAICAVPVYRMAVRYSGIRTAAFWLAATWLLYFPMHYLDIAIDLKTLRPSCYGLPFLFWGIDLAERHRWRLAIPCFLVAMSAQEDFALIIGPVGLSLWWIHRQSIGIDPAARQSSRWSLGVLLFSVIYLLAAVTVIIPAFRGGAVVHYSRYFGDLGNSPGDLIRTTLRDPLKVLGQFASWRTLFYVAALSVPAGFLFFRSPVRLAAAAGTFVMLSLIQLGDGSIADMVVPYHHFHAPMLPVLFWAAAAGLSSVSSVQSKHFQAWVQNSCNCWSPEPVQAARFAFACGLMTCIVSSMMPVGTAFWSRDSRTGYSKLFVPGKRAEMLPRVLNQLPADARVASTDYIHTRLTHFERSYDYSEYLRAVNDYQPGVPQDTDYIVLDTQHPYSQIRQVADVPELQQQPEEWEVLPDVTEGFFIVLKRVRIKKAVAKPALRDGSDPETARPQ
ncbi:MAG: DUF2079 domain-containing protein [Planctomyces sp.]|nr:DUF2079 domain-containing protein [Planctomyces sp.]